ncbi:MAG: phosphoglycerate dehydrogenase, partial [Candidatus Bathyarchaeia archaeon]
MNSIKVLVSDLIDDVGISKLKKAGFTVDVEPSIDHSELKKKVPVYDALVVRSRTKVTRDIIEAAVRLKAIARAGAGLDNIDVEAAKDRGIEVISAPGSLTTSVAELTVGLILSVLRKIPYADSELKQGRWAKKSLQGGLLKGKTV